MKEVNEYHFCGPRFAVKMVGASLHRCLEKLKRCGSFLLRFYRLKTPLEYIVLLVPENCAIITIKTGY